MCEWAENLIQIIERWKAAFPDLRFVVEEIIAEDNMAAARLAYQGTQQAEWKGISATGRNIKVHDMMFFRFEAGRIVEVWEVADEYSQLQQLTASEPLTGRQFIELVCEQAGRQPCDYGLYKRTAMRLVSVFSPLVREVLENLYQFEQPFVLDGGKFEGAFGPFQSTPHQEAIAATISWYRSRGV